MAPATALSIPTTAGVFTVRQNKDGTGNVKGSVININKLGCTTDAAAMELRNALAMLAKFRPLAKCTDPAQKAVQDALTPARKPGKPAPKTH